MRRGTANAYSCCCFNNDGSKLATVGSNPDYMLTIWDWEDEMINLRYKAFGHDVFNVSFAPMNDGQVTTSGTGHIKFWKMASTFTGLKLQGQVGKFGKVDISDIGGYVQLVDGKVLSGSESGRLLLWEGNLIKCLVIRQGHPNCHDGRVDVVLQQNEYFVTGGYDGYIRYWIADVIDNAEPSDDNNVLELKPEVEFHIGPGVQIISLIYSEEDFWVVQDAAGALWKVNVTYEDEGRVNLPTTFKAHKVLDFHAGPILDLDPSPFDHTVVTAGSDGTLRLMDYHEKTTKFYSRFSAGITKVIWNPKNIDSKRTSVTAGFTDGVIRTLERCENGFLMTKVIKPHTKAITDFAYSNSGELFVTASDDASLFFFTAKELEPKGFTKTPAPVSSIMWRHDDAVLLITLKSDTILQMACPDFNKITVSDSFEFETRFFSFTYHQNIEIKQAEETDGEQDENSATDPMSTELSMKRYEEEEYGRANALRAMYMPEPHNKQEFLVSLEKSNGLLKYTGTMWDKYSPDNKPITIETEAEYALEQVIEESSPCTSITYSKNYIVLGFRNGKVRVFDNREPFKPLAEARELAIRGLHDSMKGQINKAYMSFDDSFMLSVGSDGCFFVQRVHDERIQQVIPAKLQEIQKVQETLPEPIEDITDSTHFSIHESKIKAKEDQKKSDAESRKEDRRGQIVKLRKKFKKLEEANEKRETAVKLTRDELQIDDSIKDRVQSMIDYKLEVAEKELLWDTTWTNIKLKKLKDCYIDSLDIERIVLKDFQNEKSVSSYKTCKIRQKLREQIEYFHEKINEEIQKKIRFDEENMLDLDDDEDGLYEEESIHQSEDFSYPTPRRATTHRTRDMAGEVKKKRVERQKLKDQLLSEKPLETDEDPEIMSEILNAQQNMGDYKMKTDTNFNISESMRITAEKKLRQMILLEESMHTLRMVFNVRVLALRDLKTRLIAKFKGYLDKIRNINQELGITEELVVPSLHPIEVPEDREKIPMEDILKYEAEVLREKRRQDRKNQGLTGFPMDGTDDDGLAGLDDDEKKKGIKRRAPAPTAHRGREMTTKEKSEQERRARIAAIPLSDIEIAEKEMAQVRLEYEKARILRKMEKQIESFGAAIEELRREKFKLDGDLKNADLRLLTCFHELAILKAYEIKDNHQFAELAKKKQQKADIVSNITDITTKLAQKKDEIIKMNIEQIKKEYAALVPEKHPAREELNQIFKKSNRPVADDSDEDEDEVKPAVDVKPDKCDQKLFDDILALRQKRIEQERVLEDIMSTVESYKKEIEKNQRELKVTDAELAKIEGKIREIQGEKQRELNELKIIVVLKLSQIQSLLQNKIPLDLSGHIVFTRKGLRRLVDRIAELDEDRKKLRSRHIDLQKSLKGTQKEQKLKENGYMFAKNKVKEVQLLKFGREIDLEELEKAAENSEITELEKELKNNEEEAHEILKKWDVRINEYKDQMTNVMNENTRLLSTLATLRERQQIIENDLDASQVTMVERITKGLTGVKADRKKKLQDYALMQAREIEACKQEIALLSHKSPPLSNLQMSVQANRL
jgi:WD40 repeat protein/phenylpyruvate tautomerase PptA (4-oxalocrotonate tautomerase family)